MKIKRKLTILLILMMSTVTMIFLKYLITTQSKLKREPMALIQMIMSRKSLKNRSDRSSLKSRSNKSSKNKKSFLIPLQSSKKTLLTSKKILKFRIRIFRFTRRTIIWSPLTSLLTKLTPSQEVSAKLNMKTNISRNNLITYLTKFLSKVLTLKSSNSRILKTNNILRYIGYNYNY